MAGKWIRAFVGLCLLLIAVGARGATIEGSFCSRDNNGAPAPGLLVSFVHPNLGRSAPAYTDRQGRFTLYNVPRMATPYFIEVYWGKNLIWRKPVNVGSAQAVITLERECI